MRKILVSVFLIGVTALVTSCSDVYPTFKKDLKNMVEKQKTITHEKFTKKELEALPAVLKNYLSLSGFANYEKIQWVHIRYKGFIRLSTNQNYLPIECEQYNSADLKTRLWYGKAKIAPFLYFEARHLFKPGYANMLVKFGPFTLVDMKGPEIAQSDMITFYNDAALFMPSVLADSNIHWSAEGKNNLRAGFQIAASKAQANFYFNDKSEITNFITLDRYRLDGTNSVITPWETPFMDFRIRNGLRENIKGQATWKLPDGTDDTYFIINDKDMKIEYNEIPDMK